MQSNPRTSATIKGTVPEDVLVFVTGNGTASVAASFAGSPADNAAVLRAQPLKLTFTAADRYIITDRCSSQHLQHREAYTYCNILNLSLFQ